MGRGEKEKARMPKGRHLFNESIVCYALHIMNEMLTTASYKHHPFFQKYAPDQTIPTYTWRTLEEDTSEGKKICHVIFEQLQFKILI